MIPLFPVPRNADQPLQIYDDTTLTGDLALRTRGKCNIRLKLFRLVWLLLVTQAYLRQHRLLSTIPFSGSVASPSATYVPTSTFC